MMKYVVTTVYREDVEAYETPPYSEWLTFDIDEYDVMVYAMTCFINRHYGDCGQYARKQEQDVLHRGAVYQIEVPKMFAVLPDRSVISVFDVEVVA